jgi:hypothetical protein
VKVISKILNQYIKEKSQRKSILLDGINLNITNFSNRVSDGKERKLWKVKPWIDKTKNLKESILPKPQKISVIENIKYIETINEKNSYSQSTKKYPNFKLAYIPDEDTNEMNMMIP